MKLMDGVRSGCTRSTDGVYRYALARDWFPKRGRGHVLWVMLNPSTATAEEDDPTIRRCQVFARDWGYDGITVTNLFALRATNPRELLRHPAPVGPANDEVLEQLATARGIGLVVVAWGVQGHLLRRDVRVTKLLRSSAVTLTCLARNRDKSPKHPLYVKGDTEPQVYA